MYFFSLSSEYGDIGDEFLEMFVKTTEQSEVKTCKMGIKMK